MRRNRKLPILAAALCAIPLAGCQNNLLPYDKKTVEPRYATDGSFSVHLFMVPDWSNVPIIDKKTKKKLNNLVVGDIAYVYYKDKKKEIVDHIVIDRAGVFEAEFDWVDLRAPKYLKNVVFTNENMRIIIDGGSSWAYWSDYLSESNNLGYFIFRPEETSYDDKYQKTYFNVKAIYNYNPR